MTATPTSPADLDALLTALDAADASVRALYLKLANNPDLAPEYEAVRTHAVHEPSVCFATSGAGSSPRASRPDYPKRQPRRALGSTPSGGSDSRAAPSTPRSGPSCGLPPSSVFPSGNS